MILHADDKAGSKRPVLGSGEHTYEAYHDWGELPDSIQYGNTHGVVEDSEGRIYVHHTVGAASQSSDSMVVFDENGKFVKSWGREFKGCAHGLHIRREGGYEFLYLCDIHRGVVVKATLEGEEVFTIGRKPARWRATASLRVSSFAPTAHASTTPVISLWSSGSK
jgi:hypothetical protein